MKFGRWWLVSTETAGTSHGSGENEETVDVATSQTIRGQMTDSLHHGEQS